MTERMKTSKFSCPKISIPEASDLQYVLQRKVCNRVQSGWGESTPPSLRLWFSARFRSESELGMSCCPKWRSLIILGSCFWERVKQSGRLKGILFSLGMPWDLPGWAWNCCWWEGRLTSNNKNSTPKWVPCNYIIFWRLLSLTLRHTDGYVSW